MAPPGARRACMSAQAAGTSASSYWRSTLRARITSGLRSVGISNPPRRKLSPGRSASRARAHRSGSISMPTTSTSGRRSARRARSSTAVCGVAPYPRSTTRGRDAWRKAGSWAIHRSTRRRRLVPVVPRVIRPCGPVARAIRPSCRAGSPRPAPTALFCSQFRKMPRGGSPRGRIRPYPLHPDRRVVDEAARLGWNA